MNFWIQWNSFRETIVSPTLRLHSTELFRLRNVTEDEEPPPPQEGGTPSGRRTPLPRRPSLSRRPPKKEAPPWEGDPPRRRPPAKETPHDPPSRPTPQGEIEGDQIQAHTQGGNWGASDSGPHPRGKLSRIRSRPTPKGEIEGDQIQAHTQVGNWGGSDPGPDPRGKLRGIRSRHPSPPPGEADSGIRSMSGRYASYWNAFLLLFVFSGESMESQWLSHANVHGPSRLDGRQSAGRKVQTDPAEHPREPGGRAAGRRGATGGAGWTPRLHGAGQRHTGSSWMDSTHCPRTGRSHRR